MTARERLRTALDAPAIGIRVSQNGPGTRIQLGHVEFPAVRRWMGIAALAVGLVVTLGLMATPVLGDLGVWLSMLAIPLVMLITAMPVIVGLITWRDTVIGVEIGAHELTWLRADGRRERWILHDLDDFRFGADPMGWLVRARTRTGAVAAVRLADAAEAAWLADVLAAWWAGYATAPDEAALAMLDRVRAVPRVEAEVRTKGG